MICNKCGAELPEGATTCEVCDGKIETAEQAQPEITNDTENQQVIPEKKVTAKWLVAGIAAAVVICLVAALCVTMFGSSDAGNTANNIVNRGMAVTSGGKIYYAPLYGGIYKCDSNGENKEQVSDNIVTHLNVLNGILYFNKIDDMQTGKKSICKMPVSGGDITSICDDSARDLFVMKDKIYYSTKEGIYYVNHDGGEKKAILNTNGADIISVDNEWIYYTVADMRLLRMKHDSSNQQVIIEQDKLYSFGISVVDDKVYFVGDDKKPGIYVVSTSARDKKQLSDVKATFINIVDGYIYYGYDGADGDGNIYKLKIDGGQNKMLAEARSLMVNVVGDWVYFYDLLPDDQNRTGITRVKTDGSSKALVEEKLPVQ